MEFSGSLLSKKNLPLAPRTNRPWHATGLREHGEESKEWHRKRTHKQTKAIKQARKQTNKETNKQANKQTNKQANKQNTQTQELANKHANTQINKRKCAGTTPSSNHSPFAHLLWAVSLHRSSDDEEVGTTVGRDRQSLTSPEGQQQHSSDPQAGPKPSPVNLRHKQSGVARGVACLPPTFSSQQPFRARLALHIKKRASHMGRAQWTRFPPM